MNKKFLIYSLLLFFLTGCATLANDHKSGTWFYGKSYQAMQETFVEVNLPLPSIRLYTRSPEYFTNRKHKGSTGRAECFEDICVLDIEAKWFKNKIYYNQATMAHEIAEILWNQYPALFPDPHNLFP